MLGKQIKMWNKITLEGLSCPSCNEVTLWVEVEHFIVSNTI